MKNVKKTKLYASGGNDFAGAIGGRVTTAKSFWDRSLNLSEVAALLSVTVSEIKNSYRFKSEIKGALLPEPIFINDRGHLFFDGNSIKKLLDEHDFQ